MQYFKDLHNNPLIIDVRSPSEYLHAHIPGAVNIPLFSDENRAIVGTTYKQNGRESSVKKALQLLAPDFPDLFQKLLKITDNGAKIPLIYCARGGMRSEAMCFLLGLSGIKPARLKGGYKKYRNEVLALLSQDWKLRVVGGYTGSGKTKFLEKLKELGEQVVDLEEIARHRGSSFGALPDTSQPSNEFFENLLCFQLAGLNPERKLWVEDESRLIGKIFIPDHFFKQIRQAKVFFLEVDFEARAQSLCKQYGILPANFLIEGVRKIEKRLGGEQAKIAVESIMAGDLISAVRIVLKYYDKSYNYGVSKREHGQIIRVDYNNGYDHPAFKESIFSD